MNSVFGGRPERQQLAEAEHTYLAPTLIGRECAGPDCLAVVERLLLRVRAAFAQKTNSAGERAGVAFRQSFRKPS